MSNYLAQTAHASVADIEDGPFSSFHVTYRDHAGKVKPVAPAQQHFWAASAEGTGAQPMTWTVRDGDWSVLHRVYGASTWDMTVSSQDVRVYTEVQDPMADPKRPRPPASTQDAEVAAVIAGTPAHREADVSVSTVGTFAAGQSDDGRYVVAAEAPQSSFAAGQTEEDPNPPAD